MSKRRDIKVTSYHLDDIGASSAEDAWGVTNGGGADGLDSRTAWVVCQQGPHPDPAKPDGVILWTTDGVTFTPAVAPADIHFWKISMVGARR